MATRRALTGHEVALSLEHRQDRPVEERGIGQDDAHLTGVGKGDQLLKAFYIHVGHAIFAPFRAGNLVGKIATNQKLHGVILRGGVI